MNKSIWISALLVAAGLAACDRPAQVAVPGPAGPPGATGGTDQQGAEGAKGDSGQAGSGTTVIVVPPAASAPTN